MVITGSGKIVEVQATAEHRPFDDAQLAQMMALARKGIESLVARQQAVLTGLPSAIRSHEQWRLSPLTGPIIHLELNVLYIFIAGPAIICRAGFKFHTGALRLRRFAVKLTPGKLAGMKNVSNEHGVIAAAAMDQRGSLKKALGTRATDAGLIEFKIYVTEVLDPARQRHSARSRVGPAGRPSGAPRAPACCWPTRRRATTRLFPAACPICWICGRSAA